MATNRIKFGSDFVLKDGRVGIATTQPREKLEVAGTVLGDFEVTEVATFQSSYVGFTPQEQDITKGHTVGIATVGVGTFVYSYETEDGNVNLQGNFTTVSEDIIVEDGKIFEVTEDVVIGITTLGTQDVYVPNDSEVSVGTLESVSIQNHFSVPDGGISERQQNPIEGSVRFNDDLNTLEFYNGIEWRQFTVTGASGRGVLASGSGAPLAATFLNNIEFINIPSGGNGSNFGDITQSRQGPGGCSSSTRGLFGGGYNGPAGGLFNIIDYITIPSEGNAIDFGDLTISVSNRSACSSSTRGVWGGGANPTNVIEYVEIATIGNALDFGDLSLDRQQPSGISSPTRGIFAGGTKNPLAQSLIDFITISSKGNAIKFGDLTQIRFAPTGCSNSVRGLFGGGYIPAGTISLDKIDYITIASEGNAIDFGNLTLARNWGGGASTKIRGVFMGGRDTPTTRTNVIDFVNIASTGNAQDFGDLSIGRQGAGACSDSHGGLGGF